MSAKEKAILDIQEQLIKEHKSFLPFRTHLDSVMYRLVRQHIREQQRLSGKPSIIPDKTNSQLVAHCFFSKSGIKFDNYSRYYDNKQ